MPIPHITTRFLTEEEQAAKLERQAKLEAEKLHQQMVRAQLDILLGIKNGKVKTAGELRDVLAELPEDMPVLVMCDDSMYTSIEHGINYAMSPRTEGVERVIGDGEDILHADLPDEYPSGVLLLGCQAIGK